MTKPQFKVWLVEQQNLSLSHAQIVREAKFDVPTPDLMRVQAAMFASFMHEVNLYQKCLDALD